MYQALYRKYRPRCFCDVAGQEHVTETLRRQILGGRLSHAYLFVGTRGTGKTSCAKILSRAVNCQSPVDGEPCNACASCVGIENGSILDVLELDAASNNGVDNVRALREEAIYTPASVKKRVYIVDEVHMLSNAAFNALLKILEEPPEHLIFILATTELHKVPATILSRCQRFSFKRLSSAAISARLNLVAGSEGLTLTPDAAEKLAALADGSMRDGLSLLDQCASDTLVDLHRVLDTVGLAGQQELLRLAGAAADRDIAGTLGILDNLYNDGRDMASLLNELASLMRDVLLYKLSPDSPLLTSGLSGKELSALSKKLAPARLLSCLEVLKEALFGLSRGGSVKLAAEMCLIRICDERFSDDAPAMLARIAKLEDNNKLQITNHKSQIIGGEPLAENEGVESGKLKVESGKLADISAVCAASDKLMDSGIPAGTSVAPDDGGLSGAVGETPLGGVILGAVGEASLGGGFSGAAGETPVGGILSVAVEAPYGGGISGAAGEASLGDDISGVAGKVLAGSGIPDSAGAAPLGDGISGAAGEAPLGGGILGAVGAENIIPEPSSSDRGSEGLDGSEFLGLDSGMELKPEPSGGSSWSDILEALKGDAAVYALLSDSASVQAELQDGMLIIRANNLFTVSSIESNFSGLLRETAHKVLGRDVAIRVEACVGDIGETNRGKLERLSKFDIIQFE